MEILFTVMFGIHIAIHIVEIFFLTKHEKYVNKLIRVARGETTKRI